MLIAFLFLVFFETYSYDVDGLLIQFQKIAYKLLIGFFLL